MAYLVHAVEGGGPVGWLTAFGEGGTVRSSPRSGKGNGPELTTFGEWERVGAYRDSASCPGPSVWASPTCLLTGPKICTCGPSHSLPPLTCRGPSTTPVREGTKLEVKITSPQGIVPALGWIVSAGLRRKSQWRGRPGLWVPSPSRTRDTQSSHHSERRKGPEREGTGLDPSDEVPGSGSLSRRLVRPGRGGPGGVGHGGKSVHGSRRDGLLTDRGSDHLMAQTNPPVRGRVSADRSEEAAQPLTTPRLVRKSSTDDSVRLHCMWGLRAFGRCDAGFPRRRRVPLAWAEKGRLEAVP